MNANLQKGLKITVIVGSGAIGVKALMDVFKKGATNTERVVSGATLLIAVSAFSYAMSGQEVTLVPKTGA